MSEEKEVTSEGFPTYMVMDLPDGKYHIWHLNQPEIFVNDENCVVVICEGEKTDDVFDDVFEAAKMAEFLKKAEEVIGGVE